MRQIRIFRNFFAIFFFVASVAFLILGPGVNPISAISAKSQIVLSAISSTIGVTLVWLILTLLFGRIYCSTVCPLGAISDFCARIGRRMRDRRPYLWRPAKSWTRYLLLLYILSLLLGLVVLPFTIEPWNVMRNVTAAARPVNISGTWLAYGFSALTGMIAGFIVLAGVVVWSMLKGRDFCTDFCPLGAALSTVGDRTLYHIEIDPDLCTSCGRCEDVCSAHCIHLAERHVDNGRCLRCFDCLAVCDNNAIRFQANRNMRGTPLLRKRVRRPI